MNDIIDDISDKIFLKKLKKEFIDTVENNVSILVEYCNTGNYSGMRKIAHDIKGVAGIFGYDRGSELADDLLKLTDTGEKAKILDSKDKLIQYLNEKILEKQMEE